MKIFIDASAIIAIIIGEDGADGLAHRLTENSERYTSPLARWEAIVSLYRSRKFDWRYAQQAVDEFLENRAVTILPIDEKVGQMALSAFGNYGKGQHPAQLNMGDCFAYACAKAHQTRLLYKGNDFSQTDLAWRDNA